jgi:hypothetical protein
MTGGGGPDAMQTAKCKVQKAEWRKGRVKGEG